VTGGGCSGASPDEPSLILAAPATFGVITAQESPTILTDDINVGPRRMQFFFRVDF
jgi:hypothetical protein